MLCFVMQWNETVIRCSVILWISCFIIHVLMQCINSEVKSEKLCKCLYAMFRTVWSLVYSLYSFHPIFLKTAALIIKMRKMRCWWECMVAMAMVSHSIEQKSKGDTISKILVAWTFQFEFVQNMKVEVRWIHLYLCKIWALKLKRK